MNVITFVANLTKDAVTREDGNTTVTGFGAANNIGYGDKKTTIFFSVSVWGKRGQALEQYLTKGAQVVISGELNQREYNNKTYLEVRANEITLVGKRQNSDTNAIPPQKNDYDGDSNIPF